MKHELACCGPPPRVLGKLQAVGRSLGGPDHSGSNPPPAILISSHLLTQLVELQRGCRRLDPGEAIQAFLSVMWGLGWSSGGPGIPASPQPSLGDTWSHPSSADDHGDRARDLALDPNWATEPFPTFLAASADPLGLALEMKAICQPCLKPSNSERIQEKC